ncbi:MAG TPA: hypothetical protein VIH89_14550 [Candidatus Sulfotelmatobacter sp.]
MQKIDEDPRQLYQQVEKHAELFGQGSVDGQRGKADNRQFSPRNMHLQQTKRDSIESGGPQYYFHDLSDPVKTYLRAKGAVSVALVTPYGATKTEYFAVSTDRKLDAQRKPIPGNVGHDRIQQGRAAQSIGEAIRLWYKLPLGNFERIDVEIDIRDNAFYLTPLNCKYAGKKGTREIETIDRPLTFSGAYVSPFWKLQLQTVDKKSRGIVAWSLREICRVVKDHLPGTKLPHIQEPDILRASGPLNHLGMTLGGYVGKGYDCVTEFSFLGYPSYSIPVEIKRNSSGFHYQQKKYGKNELSRAVLLCAVHDHKHVPKHIDVIELRAFCDHLKEFQAQ